MDLKLRLFLSFILSLLTSGCVSLGPGPKTFTDASTRFVVLEEGFDSTAVLDRETDLVWYRNLIQGRFNGYPWADAVKLCTQLRVGNRFGWRLPTIQEMASLFNHRTGEDSNVYGTDPVILAAPDGIFLISESELPQFGDREGKRFWTITNSPFSINEALAFRW